MGNYIDFDEYRALPGVNWSSLKLLADSPLHYLWGMKYPRRDTEVFKDGRAVHCGVLEPDKFAEEYIIRPHGIDLRTKAGKEWKEQAGDKTIVSYECGRIIDAVMNHRAARDIIEAATTEVTVQWRSLFCDSKARIDLVTDDIGDLKTLSKPLNKFPNEAARLLYHGQLAYYRRGAIKNGLVSSHAACQFIAVEKTPPYDVGVFIMTPDEILAGERLCRHLLQKLAACTKADMWPGRYPVQQLLNLPDWAPGMSEAFGE